MTKKQAATQARTVLVQRGDYVLLEIYEKTIQAMRARVHQLEDMLASVGAGGVSPLMPAANSPEIPDGWKLVPVEPTQEMLDQLRFGWSDISTAQIIDRWKRTVDAAPQPPTTEQSSVVEPPQGEQEPVAVASIAIDGLRTTINIDWNDHLYELPAGNHRLYTSPQPPRQPPTDYQIEQLAHRTCWRYLHDRSDEADHIYTFDRNTLLEFARKLREGGAA